MLPLLNKTRVSRLLKGRRNIPQLTDRKRIRPTRNIFRRRPIVRTRNRRRLMLVIVHPCKRRYRKIRRTSDGGDGGEIGAGAVHERDGDWLDLLKG